MSQAPSKPSPGPQVKTELSECSPEENRRRSAERQRWFAEGRCPACGELGAFVAGAPVCSSHGPYPFVSPPAPDEGFDEQALLAEDEEEAP